MTMYKAIISLLLILCFLGCEIQYGDPFYEDNNVQLAQYMQRYPDTYSEFIKVLDKAEMRHTLNAYGTYTLFAPSNTAMQDYYSDKGGNSLDILDVEFCKKLVKYHLLPSKVSSAQFFTGRLPVKNYTNDYLIVEFGTSGLNSVYLNKFSLVSNVDITVSNGVIHTIETVMDPIDDDVATRLSEQSKFSIFSQALAETKLLETINVISYIDDNGFEITPKFSVFAEPDSVFMLNGIQTYEDLKARYSTSDDVTDVNNGLYQFVAYHCLTGHYYLNDFDLNNVMSFNTLSKELVSIEASDEFYINKHLVHDTTHTTIIIDGILVDTAIVTARDEFISFDISQSNNIAKNGVFHQLDKLMPVYVPEPVYFKFDFSSYPELADIRDLSTKTEPLPLSSEMEGINYKGSMVISNAYSKRAFFNDMNCIQISGEGWWVEFKLPKVLKGKYDIRLNTKKSGTSCYVQPFVDGKKLGQPVNTKTSASMCWTPLGGNGTMEFGSYFQQHQYIGSVNFTETAEHSIKFVQTTSGLVIFDYIEFYPIND